MAADASWSFLAIGMGGGGVLDLDATAVKVASARGLRVHLGSLNKQNFPENSFRAVVSSHTIEHVHDPVGLLKECRHILRPDGKLVIITPNVASWGHTWFRSNWLALDPPRHLHLFNATSLQRAAKDAGLTVSSLTTTIREADGLFRASRDTNELTVMFGATATLGPS
ncbi:class I SAM-dependent methyltransferase [Nitrosospira sp. Nsp2]|uniref:class I SAM-dependent methyltransferase n=1 Tax=Nitrosospira sp. Nsp2 TaxID=136548 RepID=UPI0015E64071|nr:class I SAM-dependent methyltransferase [Nitrosospira sp. Nsp2]